MTGVAGLPRRPRPVWKLLVCASCGEMAQLQRNPGVTSGGYLCRANCDCEPHDYRWIDVPRTRVFPMRSNQGVRQRVIPLRRGTVDG